MYYDPMISKLITWGKNRKEALDLLNKAMDEYVIRGVTHNVGFGQSILRNKSFYEGNYTTAFIPTFYPTGFRGDPLDKEDHTQLAIAAHYMKNLYNNLGSNEKRDQKSYYVSIKGDKDKDFKIEQKDDGSYSVTDIESGQSSTFKAGDFDLDYGTILRFNLNGNNKLIQFIDSKDNLNFNFYYKGNTVQSTVYDENQFAVKKYMAPPKKVDSAKSIISPMPGSIVSVSVEAGQQVTEG
jgi:propionyl-CoA carboxylase alpha chain